MVRATTARIALYVGTRIAASRHAHFAAELTHSISILRRPFFVCEEYLSNAYLSVSAVLALLIAYTVVLSPLLNDDHVQQCRMVACHLDLRDLVAH